MFDERIIHDNPKKQAKNLPVFLFFSKNALPLRYDTVVSDTSYVCSGLGSFLPQ